MFIPTLVQAESMAAEYGTPVFLTDATTIRDRAKQIATGFSAIPTKVFYAIKANYNPSIVKVIKETGVYGIDTVSPEEVQLALQLGYEPGQIIFTGSNASSEEIQTVGDLGVLQNIGSLSELECFGKSFHGRTVSIRLSPGIGEGEFDKVTTGQHESKFGITASDFILARRILDEYKLKLVGIHSHIGSGFYSVDKFVQSVRLVIATARDFSDLDFLNFGGGFGVQYYPDKPPVDVSNFAEAITGEIHNFEKENGKPVEVYIEPGKFLVAQSTVLLVRVTTLKEKQDQLFVGVDSGFNHLIRPAMYGAYHHIVNLSNSKGKLVSAAVVGNVCETCDIFNEEIKLAEPREGDLLAILVTGGYGASMSSNYNLRPMAAEVLIDGGEARLTRQRQEFGDLMQGFTEI